MHTHHTTPRIVAAVGLVIALCLPAPVLAQANCTFTGGFKILRDQIPDVVGACLEAEHFDVQLAEDGAGTMQRTTGGTLRWREAGNETFFQNDSTTWTRGKVTGELVSVANAPEITKMFVRCESIAHAYTDTLIATYGAPNNSDEAYRAMLKTCRGLAVTHDERGVTCFDENMQAMLGDIRTYGWDQSVLSARQHQRMATCLSPQS